ncbi:GNAT family N-acetyltransferase [Streptomyces sp. CAU 1734]|uniref:GNAT family N-acetyltransferase n=1 Tax=Streptomyces sp. CAU 1734 TaxID=3140360 RepID=UPI0032610A30
MDTVLPADRAELTFRDAVEEDVPVLLDLIHSAYRGDPALGGWTTEAALIGGGRIDAEGVREAMNTPGSRLLAVVRDGAVIACCRLEHRGDTAFFGTFAVRPALQAAGVGRRVLAEAERVAAGEWGARAVHMTVISVRAELIAWYERRGYRRTGELSPFPYGAASVGIPHRDDLTFELLVKDLPAA